MFSIGVEEGFTLKTKKLGSNTAFHVGDSLYSVMSKVEWSTWTETVALIPYCFWERWSINQGNNLHSGPAPTVPSQHQPMIYATSCIEYVLSNDQIIWIRKWDLMHYCWRWAVLWKFAVDIVGGLNCKWTTSECWQIALWTHQYTQDTVLSTASTHNKTITIQLIKWESHHFKRDFHSNSSILLIWISILIFVSTVSWKSPVWETLV